MDDEANPNGVRLAPVSVTVYVDEYRVAAFEILRHVSPDCLRPGLLLQLICDVPLVNDAADLIRENDRVDAVFDRFDVGLVVDVEREVQVRPLDVGGSERIDPGDAPAVEHVARM